MPSKGEIRTTHSIDVEVDVETYDGTEWKWVGCLIPISGSDWSGPTYFRASDDSIVATFQSHALAVEALLRLAHHGQL